MEYTEGGPAMVYSVVPLEHCPPGSLDRCFPLLVCVIMKRYYYHDDFF